MRDLFLVYYRFIQGDAIFDPLQRISIFKNTFAVRIAINNYNLRKIKMKEKYQFDKQVFEPLIGKFISSFHFVEDFRFSQNAISSYDPYRNVFEGIQNLVIWFYKGEQHFSLKLYAIENGIFQVRNNNDEIINTYYGIQSIGVKSDQDLRFGKSGSIRLKPPSGFTINSTNRPIERIYFYQELHHALYEQNSKEIILNLKHPTLFPDRIILETSDMYFVIRAKEDYDQDLLLNFKIGFMNEEDKYFKSGYDDREGFKYELIDKIE